MKRFKEGFTWNSKSIGMTSRFCEEDGLVLIPFCHECGQMMFRFMVEYPIAKEVTNA